MLKDVYVISFTAGKQKNIIIINWINIVTNPIFIFDFRRYIIKSVNNTVLSKA